MRGPKDVILEDKSNSRNSLLVKVNSGSILSDLPKINIKAGKEGRNSTLKSEKTHLTLSQASLAKFSENRINSTKRIHGCFKPYNPNLGVYEVVSGSDRTKKLLNGKVRTRRSPNPLGYLPGEQRHHQSVDLYKKMLNQKAEFLQEAKTRNLQQNAQKVLNKDIFEEIKSSRGLDASGQGIVCNLKSRILDGSISSRRYKSHLLSKNKHKRKKIIKKLNFANYNYFPNQESKISEVSEANNFLARIGDSTFKPIGNLEKMQLPSPRVVKISKKTSITDFEIRDEISRGSFGEIKVVKKLSNK